jgi:hypothetical protein
MLRLKRQMALGLGTPSVAVTLAETQEPNRRPQAKGQTGSDAMAAEKSAIRGGAFHVILR